MHVKLLTTIVNTFIRGVTAVRRPITEMYVLDTLVSTLTGDLVRSTNTSTLLFIASIQTVCFTITAPCQWHTLTVCTAELVLITVCKTGNKLMLNPGCSAGTLTNSINCTFTAIICYMILIFCEISPNPVNMLN